MSTAPSLLLSVRELPTTAELSRSVSSLTEAFPLLDNADYIQQLFPKDGSPAHGRVACERIGALSLLPQILRDMGLDPAATVLARDGAGRPYLVGRPADFNLSHSSAHAACAAVPPPYRVGVDVEEPIPPSRAEALARRYCTEGERAMMADSAVDFTLIWTVREAMAKYEGKGNPVAYDASRPLPGVRLLGGRLAGTDTRLTLCCSADVDGPVGITSDSLDVIWDLDVTIKA